MKKQVYFTLFLLSFHFLGCSYSQKKETTTITSTVSTHTTTTVNKETKNDDDTITQKIVLFLREQFKKELSIIPAQSRKFSFYPVDLNDDGKDEYFIHLEGTYFCGTGGCSFDLLNHDFSVNTYFTVMKTPISRSSHKTDGWHDLILFGDKSEKEGVKNYIHLRFNKAKGSYPSNPSVIKKSELAPGGHDYVMWDDTFSIPPQRSEF